MSLPGILAGVAGVGGFLSQLGSNNQFAADSAADQQMLSGLVGKQSALFNTLTNLYNTETAQGDFDPTQRLQTLQNITDHDSQLATGNAAASAATLGYRAGDSAPLQAINATNNEYKLGEQQQANQIMTQAMQQQNAAAEMPASVNLTGAENALNQNMGINNAQITSPAGLVSSVMPFLSGASGGSSATASGSTGSNVFNSNPDTGGGFGNLTAGTMAGILGGAPGMAAAGMSTPMIGAYTPAQNGFQLPTYNSVTGGTN